MEIQTSIGKTHITVCCCHGQDAEYGSFDSYDFMILQLKVSVPLLITVLMQIQKYWSTCRRHKSV